MVALKFKILQLTLSHKNPLLDIISTFSKVIFTLLLALTAKSYFDFNVIFLQHTSTFPDTSKQ